MAKGIRDDSKDWPRVSNTRMNCMKKRWMEYPILNVCQNFRGHLGRHERHFLIKPSCSQPSFFKTLSLMHWTRKNRSKSAAPKIKTCIFVQCFCWKKSVFPKNQLRRSKKEGNMTLLLATTSDLSLSAFGSGFFAQQISWNRWTTSGGGLITLVKTTGGHEG